MTTTKPDAAEMVAWLRQLAEKADILEGTIDDADDFIYGELTTGQQARILYAASTIEALQAQLAEAVRERDAQHEMFLYEARKHSEWLERCTTAEKERDEAREAKLEAVSRTVHSYSEIDVGMANARAEAAERNLAEAVKVIEGACDEILDRYRAWVADDTEAIPLPGQIPRYDAARTFLNSISKEPAT